MAFFTFLITMFVTARVVCSGGSAREQPARSS
jgi:hypothetical protein